MFQDSRPRPAASLDIMCSFFHFSSSKCLKYPDVHSLQILQELRLLNLFNKDTLSFQKCRIAQINRRLRIPTTLLKRFEGIPTMDMVDAFIPFDTKNMATWAVWSLGSI